MSADCSAGYAPRLAVTIRVKGPPEQRQNYFVIVDEAKLFLSERLCQSLEQFRKFRTGVILAGQSAYQFVRGDINLLPAILDARLRAVRPSALSPQCACRMDAGWWLKSTAATAIRASAVPICTSD